jgi:DNA modification methylase
LDVLTNRTKGVSKFFRIMHGGAINADGHGVRRVHPTQKPIKLMEEIIDQFTKPGDTVLDPFMGSGTTGVACVRTGRNFIGIEIDPDFYKIASERILSEFAN